MTEEEAEKKLEEIEAKRTEIDDLIKEINDGGFLVLYNWYSGFRGKYIIKRKNVK